LKSLITVENIGFRLEWKILEGAIKSYE